MGYTHYWYRKPKLEKNVFAQFSADVKKILEQADCPLSYYKDEEKDGFVANTKVINFNGYGQDGHENVYFPLTMKEAYAGQMKGDGLLFSCCKTAYKPYDKYVTAFLILAKLYFQDNIKVSSDGEINDWKEGMDVVNDVFDYKVRFTNIETVEESDNSTHTYIEIDRNIVADNFLMGMEEADMNDPASYNFEGC